MLIKCASKYHTYGDYKENKSIYFIINIELSLSGEKLSLNYQNVQDNGAK